MQEDMPKLTITFLLVLVVVISVVGTWVLLSELSTIEPPQHSTESGSTGTVGFTKGTTAPEIPQSSSSEAKVSLTITEEVD